MRTSTEERFWSKVQVRSLHECWEWTGAINKNGYGSFYLRGRIITASRAAWALFRGPIGALFVLHRCDNPRCVNPAHLFLGTHADNMADKVSKGRQPVRRGAANHKTKLTEDAVRLIRKRLAEGAEKRALGLEFGVSDVAIHHIARGKNWGHVH